MKRHNKILIVDDENEILATYREFFIKRGIEADIAHEGKEGLEKLTKDEYDVAIVDLKMPKLDGISMIREVINKGIDTDIIVLTGHGDKEDAVAAINLGVGAWFEKSGIKMADLLEKVIELSEGVPIQEIAKILSALPERD